MTAAEALMITGYLLLALSGGILILFRTMKWFIVGWAMGTICLGLGLLRITS